ADTAAGILAAWLAAGLLLIAPLALLFVPDPVSMRLAAISPAMGFLALLPPKCPLSPAALAPLPPWSLAPSLNVGATALLARAGRPRTKPDRTVVRATTGEADGWGSRWVERLAAQADAPVLIRELRAGVRRSDWRQLVTKAIWIALLAAIGTAYNPDFVTG